MRLIILRQALIAIAVAIFVVAVADFIKWEMGDYSEPEAPDAEMSAS